MKKLLFFSLLMLPLLGFGQSPITQYTASNGHIYNVGDTITIGRGTAQNDKFAYIQMNGIVVISANDPAELNMDATYAGLKAIIKKIKIQKIAGQERACFAINMKPLNYIIYVESALGSGEIK